MEIRNLVKEYKTNGFKISNNLMGSSYLQDLYKKGQLDIIESEKGLFFLDKSNKVAHLYYYINLEQDVDIISLTNKECIIEIIDKKSKRRNKNQVDYWIKNSFTELSENVEMILDDVKLDYQSKYDLSLPSKQDYDEIISLYETGLNPVINSYPTYEEYIDLLNKKEIYIYKKDKKILAAITKKDYGNHYLLSHIIVDKTCRGLGLGIDMIMKMLEKSDKKILLWVSKDNTNAKKIYDKIGFKYTDKMSVQLIGGMKNDRK